MPSDRWLKKVEPSAPKASEKAPNVSMAEIRKASQEKHLSNSPIPATIPAENPQDTPLETPEKPLDATHTSAERSIYSIMYRETISKGLTERHFGPVELMKKTGIRSRNTIHKALYGLREKLSVEVVGQDKGNSLGPRYRVFKPQEVERRRKAAGMKIDTQTKKITEMVSEAAPYPSEYPSGYPSGYPKNWDRGIPKIGIPGIPKIGIVSLYTKYKENSASVESGTPSSSSKGLSGDDDEAFASLIEILRETVRELTGNEPAKTEAERWREVAEILSTELKIAATRTDVSNVPAFLAEHLRRRLWKRESQPLSEEGKPGVENVANEQAQKCADCGGTGFYYPKGFDGGVAKCKHERLGTGKTEAPPGEPEV